MHAFLPHHLGTIAKALLGAEPWSGAIRTNLRNEMGIKCYNLYGTSEQSEVHIYKDIMYVEILDRKTGRSSSPRMTGRWFAPC